MKLLPFFTAVLVGLFSAIGMSESQETVSADETLNLSEGASDNYYHTGYVGPLRDRTWCLYVPELPECATTYGAPLSHGGGGIIGFTGLGYGGPHVTGIAAPGAFSGYGYHHHRSGFKKDGDGDFRFRGMRGGRDAGGQADVDVQRQFGGQMQGQTGGQMQGQAGGEMQGQAGGEMQGQAGGEMQGQAGGMQGQPSAQGQTAGEQTATMPGGQGQAN